MSTPIASVVLNAKTAAYNGLFAAEGITDFVNVKSSAAAGAIRSVIIVVVLALLVKLLISVGLKLVPIVGALLIAGLVVWGTSSAGLGFFEQRVEAETKTATSD